MRVLLFHKGGIGDVVFGLPLMHDLKHGWPGAHLTVLTHERGAHVLRHAPDVDEVLTVEEPWSLALATRALAGHSFDVAASTSRSLRGAWLMRTTGAALRAGFGGGPEAVLYTHRAPVRPFEVQFARRFQRLAAAMGLGTTSSPGQLSVSPADRELAAARLRARGWDGRTPLVAIHAGGGWPTKQLPAAHVHALVQRLHARGAQVVLQGGPGDAGRVRGVEPGVLDGTSDSIAEAIAAAPLYRAAIGIDSGLSHATAAAGVPTVFVFGPNEPASVRLGPRQQLVFNSGVPCRPCNRRGKRGCPLGHHRCLVDLTPASILEALGAVADLPR